MSSEAVGAGYLVELYNDLEALNGFVPQYQNYIISILEKNKANNSDFDFQKLKLDVEDKQKALQIIPPIRHLIISVKLKMSALRSRIKNFEALNDESFKALYLKVVTVPAPDFMDVYSVTERLNELFVEGIIDDLLARAQSIYSNSNINNFGGKQ